MLVVSLDLIIKNLIFSGFHGKRAHIAVDWKFWYRYFTLLTTSSLGPTHLARPSFNIEE